MVRTVWKNRRALQQIGWRLLAFSLLGTAAAMLAVHFTALKQVDHWTQDLRIAAATPTQPQHPAIVVLTITEDTLALWPYRSPINRHFLADLIDHLNTKGVAAIGIDVLFDRATDPAADAHLRERLLASQVPVVLAYTVSERLRPAQHAFLDEFTQPFRRGHVDLSADAYETVVRRFPPRSQDRQGKHLLSMAEQLAMAYGANLPDRLPGRLCYRGFAPDHPAGMRAAFAHYPAQTAAVLPNAWLADRIVLIGADLPEAGQDILRTPLVALYGVEQGALPGVMIHAHAVAQLLDGQQIGVVSLWFEGVIVALSAMLGSLIVAIFYRWWISLGIVLAVVLVYWSLVFYSYHQSYLLVPLLAPTLALWLSAWFSGVGMSQWERRQRRLIKQAFTHYLAPTLVDQLLLNPKQLRLGGERREISVLFTDIAGFTTLSEGLPPVELVQVMGRYLEAMSEVILAHGGTIDKFIGDAIMVLFNAPLEQVDHAERAIRCALALDHASENLRRAGCFPIPLGQTRIGVHTGDAVVGNFGSRQRFDYTAMGDTVNTASRLEGANRHFGTRVVISEETAARAPTFALRPLGEVIVKGKSRPLAVATCYDQMDEGFRNAYQQVYEQIKEHKPSARAALEELYAQYPHDTIIAYYRQRLQAGTTGVVSRFEGK